MELGQDDVEPEPLSCPVCGGETARQQKIELGEWCTLYTEACPQERMGCLHAIQERSVLAMTAVKIAVRSRADTSFSSATRGALPATICGEGLTV